MAQHYCKYYKQRKYVSYDGITWQPLNEYRKGALYEEDSEDCGYSVVYSWFDVSGEYTCSGCTKYQKTQKYISTDGGTTWEAVSPAEYGIGDVIELGSTDCGCSTQYRWVVAASEYICSGTSKYTKEYYQVSYDGGSTWQNVVPQQTRAGELIESGSTDCGYIQPIYRTLSTATTCVGYDKYTLAEYQVSYDAGFSWSTTASSATTLIEADSEDCGYVPPTPTFQGKWIATYLNGDIESADCDSSSAITENEIHKINLQTAEIGDCVTSIGYYAFAICNGCVSTLTSVTIGNNVETIGEGAFSGCTSLTNVNIPDSVTIISSSAFTNCSNLTSIDIPNSVTSIGFRAFSDCRRLTSITIGDSVTDIGGYAFYNCSGTTSITIYATTPPFLGFGAFDNTGIFCPIYVPSDSVDAYKSAWRSYASRIQAIPTS